MLNIPKVPSAKGFRFEGVTRHQLEQDLAAEIRSLLIDMRKATYVPDWQEMYNKFLGVIIPGTTQDLSRLPYPASGPNDTRGTVTSTSYMGCIYARLSWIIQLYWNMVLDGTDNSTEIREYITNLRRIVEYGIGKCHIAGDVRRGFYLEVPE